MELILIEQGGRIRGRKEGQQGSANVVNCGEDLWLKLAFVNPRYEDGIARVFVGHEERHDTSCSAVEGALCFCLELDRSKRPTTLLSIAKVSATSAP